jgi:hypothetical protein
MQAISVAGAQVICAQVGIYAYLGKECAADNLIAIIVGAEVAVITNDGRIEANPIDARIVGAHALIVAIIDRTTHRTLRRAVANARVEAAGHGVALILGAVNVVGAIDGLILATQFRVAAIGGAH